MSYFEAPSWAKNFRTDVTHFPHFISEKMRQEHLSFRTHLFYDLASNILSRGFSPQSKFQFSTLDLNCGILRMEFLKKYIYFMY